MTVLLDFRGSAAMSFVRFGDGPQAHDTRGIRPARREFSVAILAVVLGLAASAAWGQSSSSFPPEERLNTTSRLRPFADASIRDEVEQRDYARAERELLEKVRQQPDSAEYLDLLASVLFMDGKYLDSAIAYKKAEALKPLSAPSRFQLAMAYVVLGHRDWARPEVEKLAHEVPGEALYPYWLSRLDYDAQLFQRAAAEANESIKINPRVARSHDNLGLCYEALGRLEDADKEYDQAASLERNEAQPSPWPDVNRATLLLKLGRLDEVGAILREALRFDPKFPQAHYQLGLLLEKQANNQEAIKELLQASELDPSFDQPFYALGRIYHRTGQKEKAERAYAEFRRLSEKKSDKLAVIH
jgi:tetratricopeptide (TPR) repeat protein